MPDVGRDFQLQNRQRDGGEAIAVIGTAASAAAAGFNNWPDLGLLFSVAKRLVALVIALQKGQVVYQPVARTYRRPRVFPGLLRRWVNGSDALQCGKERFRVCCGDGGYLRRRRRVKLAAAVVIAVTHSSQAPGCRI